MQFVCKAAGTEVDFLLDSGASTNYVSSAFARPAWPKRETK
jgi:hypothetical protein